MENAPKSEESSTEDGAAAGEVEALLMLDYVCIHTPPRTASRTVGLFFRGVGGIGNVKNHHVMTDPNHSQYQPARMEYVMNIGKENWKAVTIVRDPIERELSMWWNYHGGAGEPHSTNNSMMKSFVEAIEWEWLNHFRNDIEPFWGINVFDDEYIFEFTDWAVYDDRLLVIRHDRLEKLHEAAEVLLDRKVPKNVKIPHVGKTDYSNLAKELKIDRDVVWSMLKSEKVRAFFSPDEIEEMRVRWTASD